MSISREMDLLKQDDVYSLVLFLLFQLKNDSKYSTLSELIYILGKEDLLKLCEYYGGMTIKIPTISELEYLIYCLTYFKYVQENLSEDIIFKKLNVTPTKFNQIKQEYLRIEQILKGYSFKARNCRV